MWIILLFGHSSSHCLHVPMDQYLCAEGWIRCPHSHKLRLVCLEMTRVSAKFWRAHKGWTVLSLSHWGRERDQWGRLWRRTEDRHNTLAFLRRKSGDISFLPEGIKVEDKTREHRVTACGNGSSERTRRCEHRARRRLRCIETKLAAHLGCRSHRWKMQTSSPNTSSGETRLLHIIWCLNVSGWIKRENIA